jgi:diamine N-acetyltransferase
MSEIVIRPAGMEDVPQGAALLQEIAAFHRALEPDHYGQRPPQYHHNRLAQLLRDPSRGAALLAEDGGGEPVGIILLHLQMPEAGGPGAAPVALIGDLVVAPARRRQGIGARLLEEGRRWAMERGAARMVLNVREANEGAVRFYESLGYRTAARWMTAPLPKLGEA